MKRFAVDSMTFIFGGCFSTAILILLKFFKIIKISWFIAFSPALVDAFIIFASSVFALIIIVCKSKRD